MASKKKTSTAMEFVVAQLEKNPKVEYRIVKDAATKKGFTIYPIMYGRAKALLGLVKVAPRGSKKKPATRGRKTATTTVARGRKAGRRARAATSPLESLQNMVSDMRDLERERDRYRRVLEQISKVIEGAL